MICPQTIYHPLYTDKEKFIILITGGRGSGKSFNAATFIERLTFELTPAERIVHQVLYTRYTMVSANMSIIPEMMEKIQLDGTDKYFSTTKTDVVNKMTNSHIMFRGIKTSSGNQTAKLKSIHGITTFVCDEAEEWTSEQDFEKIMLSIRQKGIQNRIIIIMNPTDSNHFIYKRYIENTHKLVNIDGVDVQISTHPNVLHIHTTYLDNVDNLSPQFIDEVQRMKVENPEKYGHTVIGRWADVAEGAVFKKWGIVKEFPAWAKKIALGQDFGYSNDVSATVRCGIIDNALYVDELCYQAGMLTNDLANTLRPWGLKVFSESADPRLIQEIKNRGVNIYPVDKSSIDGKGSIIAGIEKIKDMELFVTERSYNLIKELRNYVWDKDKDGNYINTPVDKDNHCFTGDTLITTYEGEKRIDRITVDDYVLTSKGYKKINKLFDNGFRKVLHIRLIFTDFIVEVKATPDHKFKTKDGWKQLQQLTKGDVLYLCKSSMAKSIDCTQANAILQEENIRCTEKYGNSIMARYQKDTMYTIKTKIDSTTQLKTSNCLNLGNILVSTCKSICNKMVLLMNSGSEWMKPESMRINGMDQKKEWNGIVNMGRWLLKTLNQKSLFANNADVNLKKSHKGKLNFAPTSVNLHIDERQALIMKQDTANSVGNRLLLGNTSKVNIVARNVRQNIYQKQRGCPMLKKRVQFAERSFSLDQRQGENSFAAGNVQGNIPQPFDLKEIEIVGEGICNVYDLNVNDEHEYFANGILVHNCMDATRYYVLGCLLGRILKPKDLTGVFTH